MRNIIKNQFDNLILFLFIVLVVSNPNILNLVLFFFVFYTEIRNGVIEFITVINNLYFKK